MSTNRLAWDEYFAAQALLIANRATCKRAKVGAVLVKDNKVIATGYNGSVSGTEHCLDQECLMIDGHCARTLHAEVNAILQGAERGIPKGFTAYVTHFPCLNCSKQCYRLVVSGLFISMNTAWMTMLSTCIKKRAVSWFICL